MNVPCPTHPGRRAHRTCQLCDKAFCPMCAVHMRGRQYCSTACARDAGRNAVFRRVHAILAIPIHPRLAVAAVAIAAAAPAILAIRAASALDRLNAAPASAPARRTARSARLETVERTADGVRLAGSASPGSAVFLFAEGRLLAAVPAPLGRFLFEGIRDDGPYRVSAMPYSAELAESLTSPRPAETLASPAAAEAPRERIVAADAPRASVAADAPRANVAAEAPRGKLVEPAARGSAVPAASSRAESIAAVPASALREVRRPDVAAAPQPAAPVPAALLSRPARGTAPPDLTRGPADRRDVTVSFDAGSSDRGATQILDALKARGIRTTIFVTGEFIHRFPSVVRRIAADGHEVGNHTDTHPHLTTYAGDGRQRTRKGVDRAFLAGELARPARLYRELTGRPMAPLWRAPFGEHNAEIRRWAAEEGYWHVGWTGGRTGLDGLDWISDPRSRGYRPAARLLARLVDHAENGGIVLLHLGSDRDEPVAAQIGALFDGLAARGFRFARASEFLEREGWNATRLAEFRRPAGATMP